MTTALFGTFSIPGKGEVSYAAALRPGIVRVS